MLEYDGSVPAIIEPSERTKPLATIPPYAVLCFFKEVLDRLHESGELIPRNDTHLSSENGDHPVYDWQIGEKKVVVMHPNVGAPLAAGLMDNLIALGCNRIVAVGSAGSLDSSFTLGQLIIPNEAVRDEGTSYHYAPPSRTVAAHPAGVATLETFLTEKQVPFVTGKTWTTDGFYRETRQKVAARQAEGCLTVEMETAAFIAVAQFRKVMFAQILYAGDDLTADHWDSRDWTSITDKREGMLRLAAGACLRLPPFA